jgi:hypothetical protein
MSLEKELSRFSPGDLELALSKRGDTSTDLIKYKMSILRPLREVLSRYSTDKSQWPAMVRRVIEAKGIDRMVGPRIGPVHRSGRRFPARHPEARFEARSQVEEQTPLICELCGEPMMDGQPLFALMGPKACHHLFHQSCFNELDLETVCPVCQGEGFYLTEIDPEKSGLDSDRELLEHVDRLRVDQKESFSQMLTFPPQDLGLVPGPPVKINFWFRPALTRIEEVSPERTAILKCLEKAYFQAIEMLRDNPRHLQQYIYIRLVGHRDSPSQRGLSLREFLESSGLTLIIGGGGCSNQFSGFNTHLDVRVMTGNQSESSWDLGHQYLLFQVNRPSD